MIDRKRNFLIALFAFFAMASATPASERLREPAKPFLKSDARGHCYVRSTPSNTQGSASKTNVYRVTSGEDELVHSFDWYSRSLAIQCGRSGSDGESFISLVRSGGAWKGKLDEISGRVTLAFYLNGDALAEYSTMDMALLPKPRSLYRSSSFLPRSMSGYSKILGFRRLESREGFEICTADGRILAFDIFTGDLVDQRRDMTDRCEQRDSRYYRGFQTIVTTYY